MQRELSAKLTEGLYFFEFFSFYNPSASHLLGTSLYTREAWVTLRRQQIYNASVGERLDSMKGSLREGAVERM